MFRSLSRTSAKTTSAPQWTITFAVAGHVIGLVITSSPGPTPSASSARCIAAVPEVTAIACFAPRYSANRSSSSAAFGPVVSQPERIVSATAAISSSPTAGGWNPTFLDVTGCIDRLEAYEIGRTASPLQRLLAALANRDHGARAVGAAPQRQEHVARLAVDPHVDDAVERPRLVDARDRAEHARR